MSKIKYNDYVEFANALENVFTQVTGDFTSPVVSYIDSSFYNSFSVNHVYPKLNQFQYQLQEVL